MALYGYQPPSITSYLRENYKVQAMEHHIEHQQQVLQLLKDNLVRKLYIAEQWNTKNIAEIQTQKTHKTRETQIYVVHPVWATSTPNSQSFLSIIQQNEETQPTTNPL